MKYNEVEGGIVSGVPIGRFRSRDIKSAGVEDRLRHTETHGLQILGSEKPWKVLG